MKKYLLINKKVYSRRGDKYFWSDESSFEQMSKQRLPKILEDHLCINDVYVFNFKLRLDSEYGQVEPDLFAFSSDYKYFALIEVETTNHSLDDHVIDQMLRMTNSNIDIFKYRAFDHLAANNRDFKKFDEDRFLDMLEFVEPEYIVVADNYKSHWADRLESIKVKLISIASYINKMDRKRCHFSLSN